MDATTPARFHTLQLFVWHDGSPESIIDDILEAGAAHARVLKDAATSYLTLGQGKRVELRAFGGAPSSAETAELGKWDVVWDLPPRCRRERPCVVVDGALTDMVDFVEQRR